MPDKTLRLNTNELRNHLQALRAGDRVMLSGTVYTARDAAHKRFFELLDEGSPLPFDIKTAVIYYAGPTPAREGKPIGSCGPTTSGRMDRFTPRLLELGLPAMIGKGQRSETVKEAMRRSGAVYFSAVGGAGALIARCVTSAEEIAFPELGCESVKKMQVKDLPLIVTIDSVGGDLYESGRREYELHG